MKIKLNKYGQYGIQFRLGKLEIVVGWFHGTNWKLIEIRALETFDYFGKTLLILHLSIAKFEISIEVAPGDSPLKGGEEWRNLLSEFDRMPISSV